MRTVCETNKCAGCMACVDICSQDSIKIIKTIESYNVVIDENRCVNCGACQKVCQVNNSPIKREPILWKQGWANDNKIRENSSSGGVATEIARAFIFNGGIVCGCGYAKGKFDFRFIDQIEDVVQLSGSKYVKSDPTGVYQHISRLLREDKKVLFIGLPCQVASLNNYIQANMKNKLYTCDLICHGSPSPFVLDLFLSQYNIKLTELESIRFRKKDHFLVDSSRQANNSFTPIASTGVLDAYMIGFLNCLFYTENCYECNYACSQRVSDITLGDSWGSTLPKVEQKRGISLALCQTDKGRELLEMANLHLENIDSHVAIEHNHQLQSPCVMPSKRKEFIAGVKKGKAFNHLIWECYPWKCFKQEVKKVLIYFHILNFMEGKTEYGIAFVCSRKY